MMRHSPCAATDHGSESEPRSDDPVIAELFADAARRGAVFRQYLPGVVLNRAGNDAQGPVAGVSFRGPGDAAAGLGTVFKLAAPPLFADHHRDRRPGQRSDPAAGALRASRVSAALGARSEERRV